MGGMSLKEKAVLAVMAMVALYALAAAYWFMGCRDTWADAAKKLAKAKSRYEMERKMISERADWDERYVEEASQIPVVEARQGSDTVWMGAVDKIAEKNYITVSDRKPGKEEMSGDMQQTTVELKWTGAVESLVKFMHELENTEEGKFDVQELGFKQGRELGDCLKTLLDEVIINPELNRRDFLISRAKEISRCKAGKFR